MIANNFDGNFVATSIQRFTTECWLKTSLTLAALTLLVWFWQPVLEMVAIAGDREAVSSYLAQFGPAAPSSSAWPPPKRLI